MEKFHIVTLTAAAGLVLLAAFLAFTAFLYALRYLFVALMVVSSPAPALHYHADGSYSYWHDERGVFVRQP